MQPEISFCGTIKWETGDADSGAFLVEDGANEIWIPKSLVSEKRQLKGSDYEFTIPEWFAHKEGII